MIYYVGSMLFSNELYHHGIKGMKWGIRRYQNPDGTLTAEGKQRYGTVENFHKHQKIKKALKTGVIVAGAVLAAYGGYRISQMLKDSNTKEISDVGKSIIEESTIKLVNADSGSASSISAKSADAARVAANNTVKVANAVINSAKSSPKPYTPSRTYSPPPFDMRSALNKSLKDLNDMSGLNDLRNAQEELRRLREMLNGH